MKSIQSISLIGCLLCIFFNVEAQLVVNSVEDTPRAGASYTTITVQNEGRVTFNGDVFAEKVYVYSGAMIVNGSLTVSKNGGDKLAQLIVDGTLIVSGNLTVVSNQNAITEVQTNGIMVVGGAYSSDGGNGKNSTDIESSSGAVFLSDPADGSGIDGNGVEGDITDLIESDLIDDEVLIDFIDNSGIVLPGFEWEGTVNADWNNASNWANTQVPTNASNITVSATPAGAIFPTECSNGIYSMWNLTLEDGARLIIPEGSQVTIFGDIVIKGNAELIVQNSNVSPTSFLNYGDVLNESGGIANVTFKWTFDNLRWRFIGHPIANPSRDSYQDLRLTQSNNYVLYDYQDPNVFYNVSDISKAYDLAAQNELKGYNFRVLNSGAVVSHTGVLNNETAYEKTLQTEWQIIANPYASYYQIPSAATSLSDFENTTGTIYVSTSSSNADKNFETYNVNSELGSPQSFTGIIAPNQAFYVKTVSAGSVFMRAAHRVHDANKGQLKSSQAHEIDVIRMKLSNGSTCDEAVLAFRENGSESYSKFDSDQRFQTSSSRSYLYSIKDSISTVINMLPKNTELTVPFGYKAKAGVHSIQFNGINSLTNALEMVLEDKVLGESVMVMPGLDYRFTVDEETNNERFVLHIKPAPIATTIDEEGLAEDMVPEDGVKIYMSNASLNVECNWKARNKTIFVYSVLGNQLVRKDFQSNQFSKQLLLSKGIYVVRVVAGHKTYEQKIAVK